MLAIRKPLLKILRAEGGGVLHGDLPSKHRTVWLSIHVFLYWPQKRFNFNFIAQARHFILTTAIIEAAT